MSFQAVPLDAPTLSAVHVPPGSTGTAPPCREGKDTGLAPSRQVAMPAAAPLAFPLPAAAKGVTGGSLAASCCLPPVPACFPTARGRQRRYRRVSCCWLLLLPAACFLLAATAEPVFWQTAVAPACPAEAAWCMSMLWFDVAIWSELMTMKSIAVACTDHAFGVVDRDSSFGQQLESSFTCNSRLKSPKNYLGIEYMMAAAVKL